jgi:hypothetical protein
MGKTGKLRGHPEGTPRPPGPEPDRLKLEGDWEELAGKAVKKKRPKEGWPKPSKKKSRGK